MFRFCNKCFILFEINPIGSFQGNPRLAPLDGSPRHLHPIDGKFAAEAPELVLRLGIICLSENAEDGKMLSAARSGPICPRRYPGLIRINAPIPARH
jgi:hypothetical protein